MGEAAEGGVGLVSLVGAGPGDPRLITVRGLERLRAADVVIHDHLVSKDLLAEAPPGAERIYVGKWAGARAMPQSDINELLVTQARLGRRVVRLKGGDPFVFGRGGEEATHLADRGVPFEVVPGVSAISAVPAYAGIPVTDRRAASSFIVVTGHEDPSREAERVRWDRIAKAADTVVVLMGTTRLPQIARALVHGGRSEHTPAAVIQWGTTPRQRTVVGTLADIAERVVTEGITAPSTLIVGDVVALREHHRWFDTRPLLGRCVLLTRAAERSDTLATALAELGADTFSFPVIATGPPESLAALDAAIARLPGYDWVVFTSSNAVDAFMARLEVAGRDLRALGGVRVCCVGPATAARTASVGLLADLVPKDATAEGVMVALEEALGTSGIARSRFLMPRAEEGRDVIPEGIAAAGGTIDVVTAYRTVCPEQPDAGELVALLERRAISAVTLTSPSCVRNLAKRLGGEERLRALLHGVAVATIGPTTSTAARKAGLPVDVEASPHTVEGLVQALAAYYSRA